MKMILIMLMFVVGCVTSLAALDLGPPTQKGVILQSTEFEVIAPITVVIHQEVNILHRDSLMYSVTPDLDGTDTTINADIKLKTKTTSQAGVTGV